MPDAPPGVFAVVDVAEFAREAALAGEIARGVTLVPRVPLVPYAVLDGEGEAVVAFGAPEEVGTMGVFVGSADQVLAVRIDAPRRVEGRVFALSADHDRLVEVPFTLPAEAFSADHAHAFQLARTRLHHDLRRLDLPGAAWFRHRAREDLAALGRIPEYLDPLEGAVVAGEEGRLDVEDTFTLVSGGRALSENLQLERVLPWSDPEAPTVAVDTIEGIDIAAYDWEALLEGTSPVLDPLAALVPHDQHAAFLPDVEALVALSDELLRRGSPLAQIVDVRAQSAHVRERYERQLGLPLSEAIRALAPLLVEDVALTGGDPFFRTGTDVALLLASTRPDALRAAVETLVAGSCRGAPGLVEERLEAPVAARAWWTPDRAICSYVARVGDAVVVTNSRAQLARIAETASGARAALASQPEYVWFRDLYARGAAGETALVVLSDATIRRWAGPRWRIGMSRRTRAAAVLAEWQARAAPALLAGTLEPGPVAPDAALPDIGPLAWTPAGVRSDAHGTLAFQTPIVEMDLDLVTEDEADLYWRWRQGYLDNWTAAFDPIAVRLALAPGRLDVDLMVTPLIRATEYAELIDIARGSRIAAHAGDPHEGTLMHLVLAVDARASELNEAASMVAVMAPGLDPLAWVGQSLAIYVDDAPFLDALLAADDLEVFLEEHVGELPVALHVEVASALKLAGFLAGLRAFVQQSAPGMTAWRTRKHGEQEYVEVAATDGEGGVPEDLALYYAGTGDGLVLTLDEALLQRALDRRAARAAARAAEPAAGAAEDREPAMDAGEDRGPAADAADDREPAMASPWFGEHLALSVERGLIAWIERACGERGAQLMLDRCWRNGPILREWARLAPGLDPVAAHERLFDRTLVCPAGGAYVWDAAQGTVVCSVHGEPSAPRARPGIFAGLSGLQSADFGLTFAHDGLRARAVLVDG